MRIDSAQKKFKSVFGIRFIENAADLEAKNRVDVFAIPRERPEIA